MNAIYRHMNATLGGVNLHPGVNLLPGANLHPGANCAHEHGFRSEKKGADQLRGYREADLRLCFRTCRKPVLSRRGYIIMVVLKYSYNARTSPYSLI